MEIQENNYSFLNVLKNRQFKKSKFNQSVENHIKIVDTLQKIQIPQNQQATKELLKLFQQLLKFYGFPIFICLQKFYAKIATDPDFVTQNIQELKILASIVKSKVQDRRLQQLSFYFKLSGTSRKKYNFKTSEQQNQFIQYIQKISQMYSQAHALVQNGLKRKAQTKFREIINDKINNILQADIQIRKLNVLEANYQSFIKSKAISIIQQISNILLDQNFCETKKAPKQQKITEQQKSILKIDPNAHLCCRTFFLKGQTIHQPQSLNLQYKNYNSFPQWPIQQQNILKKTICGFLNADGGTIFIGIAQSVDSKRRIVQGSYYDQSAKQQVLKFFTRIARSIEPDIITHKLYGVQFVPVRNNNPPYKFISGKYVIKVTIRYGVRDDIYSYKKDNQDTDYFAFRTENQVVHRSGRMLMNALKERVRNPIPIPDPVHQGPCPRPDVGKPIYHGEKFDQSFEEIFSRPNGDPYIIRSLQNKKSEPENNKSTPQGNLNNPQNKKSEPEDNKSKTQGNLNNPQNKKLEPGNNKSTPQGNLNNPPSYNKKFYRPSKLYFLIKGAHLDKLFTYWKHINISHVDLKAKSLSNKQTMVQLDTQQQYVQFLSLAQKMKEQIGVQIIQPTDKIEMTKNLEQIVYQSIWDSLIRQKIQVQPGPTQWQIRFKDIPAAMLANSIINADYGIQTRFT